MSLEFTYNMYDEIKKQIEDNNADQLKQLDEALTRLEEALNK